MGITLTDVVGFLGSLVQPKDLDDPKTREPLVQFLTENNCKPGEKADWPEMMDKLDSCRLWHKVGPTFDKIGLVHPFDPRAIDKLKGMGIKEEDLKKCEKNLTQVIEKFELTAFQSFFLCYLGANDGSCSETAYKFSAKKLNEDPNARIEYYEWPEHIAAFDLNDKEGIEKAIDWYGRPLYHTDRPSELLNIYYYSRSGQINDKSAMKLLEKFFPDSYYTLLMTGKKLIDEGNFGKAFEVIQKLEAKGFKNDGLILSAYFYQKVGETKKAQTLERLYHYNLGTNGNFPAIFDLEGGNSSDEISPLISILDSARMLLAFLGITKNYDLAELLLAGRNLREKDYATATAYCNEVIANSKNPQARNLAYEFLSECTNLGDSRNYIRSALYLLEAAREVPADGDLLMSVSNLYMYATGDLKLSLDLLDAGRFYDPTNPEYLLIASDIYLNAFDRKSSYKYAKMYVDLTKTNPYDNQEIPFILLYTEDYVQAEESFKHLLEKDPGFTNYLAGLTLALFGQGKEEYKSYLKKLIDDKGAINDEMFYFTLERIAFKSKDIETGFKFAGFAKAIAPGFGAATWGGEYKLDKSLVHKPTDAEKEEALEYARKFL